MTNFVKASPARIQNASGTIIAAGVSQVLMAANPERSGFWVQNLSAADLWINEIGNANTDQPSRRISAGTTLESPMTGCPTGTISIVGGTAGQAFSARQW